MSDCLMQTRIAWQKAATIPQPVRYQVIFPAIIISFPNPPSRMFIYLWLWKHCCKWAPQTKTWYRKKNRHPTTAQCMQWVYSFHYSVTSRSFVHENLDCDAFAWPHVPTPRATAISFLRKFPNPATARYSYSFLSEGTCSQVKQATPDPFRFSLPCLS